MPELRNKFVYRTTCTSYEVTRLARNAPLVVLKKCCHPCHQNGKKKYTLWSVVTYRSSSKSKMVARLLSVPTFQTRSFERLYVSCKSPNLPGMLLLYRAIRNSMCLLGGDITNFFLTTKAFLLTMRFARIFLFRRLLKVSNAIIFRAIINLSWLAWSPTG